MNMELLEQERKIICGELWPDNIDNLVVTELFERHITCAKNARIAWGNGDVKRWAAWDNANTVYIDVIRKRLAE